MFGIVLSVLFMNRIALDNSRHKKTGNKNDNVWYIINLWYIPKYGQKRIN